MKQSEKKTAISSLQNHLNSFPFVPTVKTPKVKQQSTYCVVARSKDNNSYLRYCRWQECVCDLGKNDKLNNNIKG